MIKSLDEDPSVCGYSESQIEKGLLTLEAKSVKQIGSDAAHLYFMLLTKNLLKENSFTKKVAREHPEIMSLRFDKERSNLEDLPQHIRKPLFDILIQYAGGAVQRTENSWKPIDVNEDFLNSTKYKYDDK